MTTNNDDNRPEQPPIPPTGQIINENFEIKPKDDKKEK